MRSYERAVEFTPEDSIDLPGFLNNLGTGLSTRYARTGAVADLDRTVRSYERAVELTPEDSIDLPGFLNNLGTGLSARYARTGAVADFDRAVRSYERAVELTPEDSPDLPSRLNNLGNGLNLRYARTGVVADLDRAVRSYERATELTPENSPDLPRFFNNLGTGVRTRYARTGAVADLDRAVWSCERATELTPEDSPDLPTILNNLGTALRTRYDRTGAVADLDRAVWSHERASELTPENSPGLPGSLSNLGTALRTRYARIGAVADLDRAVRSYEHATELTPENSPDLPGSLNNLGTGLDTRYARTGAVADLDRAVRSYERATELSPEDSPDLPSQLNNLGNGLRMRYARTGAVADLDRAVRSYERACREGLASNPDATIMSSRSWSRWAAVRGAWTEVLQATTHGLEAGDLVHRAQVLRADQESWRGETHRLPALRGYAQARVGDLRGAALTLERGRARFVSEALDRDRADLETLAAAWPAEVRAYQEAAERVRALEAIRPDGHSQASEGPVGRREQLHLAREALDQSVQAIRSLPGQERFLTEPTWEDLAAGLEEGVPTVYLAVTEVGALALVLLQRGGALQQQVIWADGLTEVKLRELLYGPADDPKLGGWLGAMADHKTEDSEASRRRWHDSLASMTRALWDLLMGAVVDHLEALGVEEAVLVPGGLLGLLPLHAAWTDAPAPRAALDRIAFRVAPSLRVLTHARRIAEAGQGAAPHLLAVCEPKPVAAVKLPFTPVEVQAITSFFDQRTELTHTHATREATLAALPSAQVAHFSCHGSTSWGRALQSGLLMAHNHTLTVQDLLEQRLPGARLAVLSACETGIPGTALPDEVVAMPVALIQAGFAGVVASLWSVYDLSTALLMIRFYELWLQDGLRPAVALQRSQLWMRDTTNAEKVAHFAQQIPTFNLSRLPVAPAEIVMPDLAVALGTRDPNARDYAHPIWWAAFTYTGV